METGAHPSPDVTPPPVVAAALLRSLADGLYVVDREGRVIVLNPAGQRLLGYDEEELVGRDIHTAIHFQDDEGRPLHRATCGLLSVLATGEATRAASDWFTRKDGRVMEVAYTSSAIVEEGAITGAVVLFRDVTEPRAVERRAAGLALERRDASEEWQRNLLPVRLAEICGVDVAVSFRPVGADALIGGDFYDVLPHGEGHMLVLGDVCGKGPGAAAIAAMVRFLLRGAASRAMDARALLGLVNDELMQHPTDRFCTLVLAALVPRDDGRLQASVSCAGHPQPVLLTADGSARPVGGTGQLVGVFEDVDVRTEEVLLASGDSLVLFSDGLTDVRGRSDDQPRTDVAALLAGTTGLRSAEVVSHLERLAGVVEVEELPDDVAILVARLEPVRTGQPTAPPVPVGAPPADPEVIGTVEAAFRDGNERLVAGRPDGEETVAVTCECGHDECDELIAVPHLVYDRVRADVRCFILTPGHEIPRAEVVTERHDGFCVVRKHGEAGDVAAILAP